MTLLAFLFLFFDKRLYFIKPKGILHGNNLHVNSGLVKPSQIKQNPRVGNSTTHVVD